MRNVSNCGHFYFYFTVHFTGKNIFAEVSKNIVIL